MIDDAQLARRLLQHNLIDRRTLRQANALSAEHGEGLYQVFLEHELVDRQAILAVVGDFYDIPYVLLDEVELRRDVLELVDRELVVETSTLPLGIDVNDDGDHQLLLGMTDPLDMEAMERVSNETGLDIRPVLIGPHDLARELERAYPEPDEGDEFEILLSDLAEEDVDDPPSVEEPPPSAPHSEPMEVFADDEEIDEHILQDLDNSIFPDIDVRGSYSPPRISEVVDDSDDRGGDAPDSVEDVFEDDDFFADLDLGEELSSDPFELVEEADDVTSSSEDAGDAPADESTSDDDSAPGNRSGGATESGLGVGAQTSHDPFAGLDDAESFVSPSPAIREAGSAIIDLDEVVAPPSADETMFGPPSRSSSDQAPPLEEHGNSTFFGVHPGRAMSARKASSDDSSIIELLAEVDQPPPQPPESDSSKPGASEATGSDEDAPTARESGSSTKPSFDTSKLFEAIESDEQAPDEQAPDEQAPDEEESNTAAGESGEGSGATLGKLELRKVEKKKDELTSSGRVKKLSPSSRRKIPGLMARSDSQVMEDEKKPREHKKQRPSLSGLMKKLRERRRQEEDEEPLEASEPQEPDEGLEEESAGELEVDDSAETAPRPQVTREISLEDAEMLQELGLGGAESDGEEGAPREESSSPDHSAHEIEPLALDEDDHHNRETLQALALNADQLRSFRKARNEGLASESEMDTPLPPEPRELDIPPDITDTELLHATLRVLVAKGFLSIDEVIAEVRRKQSEEP
jgi:hypothetical protein